MRANSATRSWGRKVLIPGESRRWVKIILSRLPEVPDLDIQLCDSSVDILSNRTLSVDGK